MATGLVGLGWQGTCGEGPYKLLQGKELEAAAASEALATFRSWAGLATLPRHVSGDLRPAWNAAWGIDPEKE